MTNKVTKSWAIRSSSRAFPVVSDDFTPYMEVYYPNREVMREAWRNLPDYQKGIGATSVMFKSERFRVISYDLIGKRSYTPVR